MRTESDEVAGSSESKRGFEGEGYRICTAARPEYWHWSVGRWKSCNLSEYGCSCQSDTVSFQRLKRRNKSPSG
jgi:hypothetical protein